MTPHACRKTFVFHRRRTSKCQRDPLVMNCFSVIVSGLAQPFRNVFCAASHEPHEGSFLGVDCHLTLTHRPRVGAQERADVMTSGLAHARLSPFRRCYTAAEASVPSQQATNQSVNQPTDQAATQAANQTTKQATNQATKQPNSTNRQTNRQTNQPTKQPTNQPTNQPTRHTCNKQTNKQTCKNKKHKKTKTNMTRHTTTTNEPAGIMNKTDKQARHARATHKNTLGLTIRSTDAMGLDSFAFNRSSTNR